MKILLLISIALLLSSLGSSQSCIPYGIEFSTQGQIDSFQVNYPNCTEIEGNLWIIGNEITNLNGLNVLTSIGGELYLNNSDALTSLIGLDNVTSIGRLIIYSNNLLTNLEGLGNVITIEYQLFITTNISLTSLSGLNNLTTIGQFLEIIYNDSLTNLAGLGNLTSIGTYVWIANNPALSNISDLGNLNSIGGYLTIFSNAGLTTLDGLDNLTSIGGDNYEGDLAIYDNTVLTSIAGLDNLDAGAIRNLAIYNNPSLTICDAQSVCNYLSNPNGIVQIYANNTGCNNLHEVANDCGITIPCLPFGNYYFTTQAEIDSFQSFYPNCINLQGSVYIEGGGDIANLFGLSVVTSIGNNIEIRLNDSLTSLNGLDNLTSLGGKLIIRYNDALTDIKGVGNIDAGSITDLWIHNNASLSSCEVQSVCDYLASPNSTAIIQFNAAGCNTKLEILAACQVGLNENTNTESDIIIYPNPGSNQITIETLIIPTKSQILMFNSQGQAIIQRWITGPRTIIDISDLTRGIYYMKLTSDSTVKIFRIIKN
ncbi:MAG: leucine-rich repeat domain-containing protein [Bacteroidales bacterium]|nr:leucine-rich repeat domain-containing protein [Bacteroidales bacterium]